MMKVVGGGEKCEGVLVLRLKWVQLNVGGLTVKSGGRGETWGRAAALSMANAVADARQPGNQIRSVIRKFTWLIFPRRRKSCCPCRGGLHEQHSALTHPGGQCSGIFFLTLSQGTIFDWLDLEAK
jgi:hypothetical protein